MPFFAGTMACTCCGNCANGEAGDRDSEFDPEGDQLALLSAVLKATAGSSTEVVVVLIHGRPVTFGGAAGDQLLLGGDGVPGVDALVSKNGLLSHLYLKTNILPRQARDKHRETSKKGPFFLS
jgi:hypothetical protein